jgi:uncharacterized protein (TIGR04141 family)
MKLNIFKIPKDNVADLKTKFNFLNLKNIHSKTQSGWNASFYFSKDAQPSEISWVAEYQEFFDGEKPENTLYFAVYLWENNKYCFGISYGKSHFYLRQYCDHDFGIEIAKRIANQKDIRQKSSKKFAGRKKKEIKSYTKNSKLDIESGESIDYLQSSIEKEKQPTFGKSAKFGSSVNLNPEIDKDEIGDFLNDIIKAYESKEVFKLPRTLIIDGQPATIAYENTLINELTKSVDENADFTTSGHDLIGVDFIFSGQEKYIFMFGNETSEEFDEISIQTLNNFISDNSIPKERILEIRVQVTREGLAKPFSKTLKESLDYSVPNENVILSQGKWMQFNEDYVTQLNEYIDTIDIEETENDLIEIKGSEDDFNKSLEKYGYENADKDFSKIKIDSGVLIEAWDSKKGDTVYAVKFGSTQKLGYVCDQANATLEIIAKKANVKKLDNNFKNYCLWIGVKTKNIPEKISAIKSIIFKQKIESWARKCSEFGIIPKIKISKHNSN